MKRNIAILLTAILVGFVALSSTRPVNASIDSSIYWVKPALRGVNDQYLGYVSAGYVTGTTWTLNVRITSDAWNSTPNSQPMDARIFRVAVWFDWNRFYNTSLDVTVKYGDSRLFTVTNTTEDVAVASNMFTHSYRVYVEYKITYMDASHTATTKERTWSTSEYTGFAVLSQDQFNSRLAADNFRNYLASLVSSSSTYYTYYYGDQYAESMSLRVQAMQENKTGTSHYGRGEFSTALGFFNNAMSLLNQSRATYVSKQTVVEAGNLNRTLAETDAIKANATATRTISQATANAALINSFAFILFGLGFIFFGIAAILFVRKGPKPT
jgi:hypothetical protein